MCAKRRALFIGGTGIISTACVDLAIRQGFDVTLLNRGNRPVPAGVKHIVCDVNNEEMTREALDKAPYAGFFDVVADFVAFTPNQVERDIRLFSGRTDQYIYISSASAYQKPLSCERITESTPLHNPFWQYSRDKIACEQVLTHAYNEAGFPITIVRPSHTYDDRTVPCAIHGDGGSWQTLKRMLDKKPVLIHGDGLTWWTMTYSKDLAIAFVGLMCNPHAVGESVHITSDECLTWNQIYQIIGKHLGVETKLAHVASETLARLMPGLEGMLLGDKANSVRFDNSKIKGIVPEFCAATRFDQGIQHAINYMLSNKDAQIPDPAFDAFCDRVIAAEQQI